MSDDVASGVVGEGVEGQAGGLDGGGKGNRLLEFQETYVMEETLEGCVCCQKLGHLGWVREPSIQLSIYPFIHSPI